MGERSKRKSSGKVRLLHAGTAESFYGPHFRLLPLPCACARARASKRLSFPSRKNFCPKLLYDIAAAAAMTHRSWRQLWRSFGGGALLTQSATWSGMFWPHFHPSYMANRTMALFGCLKPIYSDYRITWQQMMVQCLLDIVNSTVLWQNSHHVQYVTIKYMPHIANHDSQNKQ